MHKSGSAVRTVGYQISKTFLGFAENPISLGWAPLFLDLIWGGKLHFSCTQFCLKCEKIFTVRHGCSTAIYPYGSSPAHSVSVWPPQDAKGSRTVGCHTGATLDLLSVSEHGPVDGVSTHSNGGPTKCDRA